MLRALKCFFFKPSPTRCWHPGALTRAGPKVTAVIDLHGYSLLILWTEERKNLKFNNWQQLDFVYRHLLLARGYLVFNTVTVIFYWDENIMFLFATMTPDLWVTPCKWLSLPRLLICMVIRPLHKYGTTLHEKLDSIPNSHQLYHLLFTAC